MNSIYPYGDYVHRVLTTNMPEDQPAYTVSASTQVVPPPDPAEDAWNWTQLLMAARGVSAAHARMWGDIESKRATMAVTPYTFQLFQRVQELDNTLAKLDAALAAREAKSEAKP